MAYAVGSLNLPTADAQAELAGLGDLILGVMLFEIETKVGKSDHFLMKWKGERKAGRSRNTRRPGRGHALGLA
jgi:hypothetical protein